jgi:hypothetical protein
MTLAELLAPYGVSDEEYLAVLAYALGSSPRPESAALSSPELEVLARWSGIQVPPGGPEAPGRTWVTQATANLAEQLNLSLSAEEAGIVLKVSASRVRHRVNERSLYAFKTGNQLRLPLWQFHKDELVPGLSKVLEAIDPGLHPLEVAGFMTSPDDDLVIAEEPATPRAWLIGGGDPLVVAHLASLIGAGW